MAFPKIGNLAPAFTLPDQDGNKLSLRQYRDQKNVVVLGVSPDPVARLGKFIDKEGLNFTLLSDEDHAVAEKYGAWGLKKFMGREFMGILRSTFIIGRDGRLKHVMDKVRTKTHHDDVLALIRELGPGA